MRTKILLAMVILFCIAFTSSAQINKGRILIGGSFGYYSAKNGQGSYYNNSQSKIGNLNIQIGKAVANNSVAGVILSDSYNKSNFTNFPDSNSNKDNEYNVGIFYRKYKKIFKELYIFGEIDAEYSYSESSSQYLQNGNDRIKTISSGGVVYFVPGLSYQLCKRILAELTMPNIISTSYKHFKIKYNIPPVMDKGNTFSFNANLNSNLLSNFGIGFKFLLGK